MYFGTIYIIYIYLKKIMWSIYLHKNKIYKKIFKKIKKDVIEKKNSILSPIFNPFTLK